MVNFWLFTDNPNSNRVHLHVNEPICGQRVNDDLRARSLRQRLQWSSRQLAEINEQGRLRPKRNVTIVDRCNKRPSSLPSLLLQVEREGEMVGDYRDVWLSLCAVTRPTHLSTEHLLCCGDGGVPTDCYCFAWALRIHLCEAELWPGANYQMSTVVWLYICVFWTFHYATLPDADDLLGLNH